MRYSRPYLKLFLLAWFTSFFTLFSSSQVDSTSQRLSYLALGDSYTIGESVSPESCWPIQLKNALDSAGYKLNDPKIIAKTGWRTDDMLSAATKNLVDTTFDIVSLLIGVNNEYQGKTVKSFEKEFERCLKYAISKSKYNEKGVFVVSIPDYGYTPFGKKNQESISIRIDAYNSVCQRISKKYDVLFIDITGLSRKVLENNSLVASDNLHPSGEQYSLWVNKAVNKVVGLISSY